MSISEVYKKLFETAYQEFGHIITDGSLIFTPAGVPQKLRLEIIDGSLVDVFLSRSGRYSYHWERRHIDGRSYRHDNAPHSRWRHLSTFPKHFHDGFEDEAYIRESYISEDPVIALRSFMKYLDNMLDSM